MDIDWYWQKAKYYIKYFCLAFYELLTDWSFLKGFSIKETWNDRGKSTIGVMVFTFILWLICQTFLIYGAIHSGVYFVLVFGTLYFYLFLKTNLSDSIKQYRSLKEFVDDSTKE